MSLQTFQQVKPLLSQSWKTHYHKVTVVKNALNQDLN